MTAETETRIGGHRLPALFRRFPGLLAAAIISTAGMACADDLDDILNVEPASNVVAAVPGPAPDKAAPAGGPSPEAAARFSAVELKALFDRIADREIALAKARTEIAKLNETIAKLSEIGKRDKVNGHYNMGCVYRACGQFTRAEEEFLKALAIDPKDAGVHYNLGVLYDDNLRNRRKAKLHYRSFVELSPGDPDAGKVQEWLLSQE